MTELLPCPHCGSEQITPVPDRNWGCVSWAAVCRECAARTGPYNTEAEAIALWNQRTSPPAADAEQSGKLVEASIGDWRKGKVTEIPPIPDSSALEATAKQAWQAELRGAKLVEELAAATCLYADEVISDILPIIARERDQAWQDGAKAALEAAAEWLAEDKFQLGDYGINLRDFVNIGDCFKAIRVAAIRAIDPASIRKDRT